MKKFIPIPLYYSLFLVAAFAILSCNTQQTTDSNTLRFSTTASFSACNGNGTAKKSATVDNVFVCITNADSSKIIFHSTVLCTAEYQSEAIIKNDSPDTLRVALKDVGSMRSLCVCDKEITVVVKPAISESVKALLFNEKVFIRSEK